jgi:hypothetical protein
MIVVLTIESQKNVQSSPLPSSGVVVDGGPEPPGVGVYGLRNVTLEPEADMAYPDLSSGPIRSRFVPASSSGP